MKFRTVIYTSLLAALCMGCGGRLSMHELEHLEARMDEDWTYSTCEEL